MRWVIAATFCVYALVNAPLVYALVFTHGPSGIARLWGFAPNQFLFLTTIFPVATFASLTALHLLVTRVGPVLSSESRIRWYACQNWAALLLVGALLASLFGLLIYYGSSLSFDKLKTPFAARAVQSFRALQDQIHATKVADREEFIRSTIRRARLAAEQLPMLRDSSEAELAAHLASLPPEVFLQVVAAPSRQLRLGILDSGMRALNVLQLFVALLVAFCAMATAIVCLILVRQGAAVAHGWQIGEVLRSVYVAAVCFAAYPICYAQHRREIETVTGLTTSAYQDVFTGLFVVVCLAVVWLANPSSKMLSLQNWLQGLPILFVGTAFVAERTFPEFMAQFIGTDTTPAIQGMISLVVIVIGVVAATLIWPRQ